MIVFPSPRVTDELPIAIRAYAVSTYRTLPDATKAKSKRKSIVPASPWALVFDTETTTDVSQALRFATYQLRHHGELVEAGIIYDPDGVNEIELGVLRSHADANGLVLRTRNEFVDEIFFARAWQLRATIIGFNLPFDISRLAISHASARSPKGADVAAMRGGFTFKLSSQKIYPNIRVKHMSRKAALISFAKPMGQPNSRGQCNRGIRTGARRGHFIDVKTLASALFAKGFSLSRLSHFLQVPNPKLDFDNFDAPISDDMVRYAVRDTQATWECYVELIKRFEVLSLTQSTPEKIYSEAGIGKGYIRQMGILPWRKVQPHAPSDMIAKIMGSYFGGRSEVRIRREISQVILCDFLSMYPTVCTLMGLWNFVIADGMTWHNSTAETREFLNRIDLNALQSPPIWSQLTTLVRVLPNADIFPVRASYSDEAQSTIGANYLSSDTPLWFTLADCIASKLLTDKAPEIVEAISFAPAQVQSGLEPIDIAGNPQYCVDPNTTDFFKRVIELRQSIKRQMANATDSERERLDTEQNALKICANSTSYGIWVEVNVETRPEYKSVTVHNSTGERFTFTFPTDKAEMPGTYFHPLLATLITGAARLMLTIAERLATDKGLNWAFCDTDSMAFAKPLGISSDEFAARVASIVEWFAALNPYDFGGSILKIEDVNASLETSAPQPLYCLAISSKRYALFNLSEDDSPIMRKVSAHGLGHLSAPYDDTDAPANFPIPHKSVLRDGTLRWHCDLWHQIVISTLAGHPDQAALDYHSSLKLPAISRYAATSPDLLRWFKCYNASRPYREQVKPFGFLLSLREAFDVDCEPMIAVAKRGRRKKRSTVKPIAPFENDHRKALTLAFDRETGAAVPKASLCTYAEALAQYHISPESKFLNGDYLDRGTTKRRHICVMAAHLIGKESNDWERQAALGWAADRHPEYGISDGDRSIFQDKLRPFIERLGSAKAARALNMTPAELWSTFAPSSRPTGKQLRTLASCLQAATQKDRRRSLELSHLRRQVAKNGLRATARALHMDPSNLRRQITKTEH